MRPSSLLVTIDAADIDAEAAFWAAALEGEVVPSDDDGPYPHFRDVVVDGRSVLAIQYAPDHVAPEWHSADPDRQHQQIHLDIYVPRDEVDAAREQVEQLGARLLQEAPDPAAETGFHVLADPAGHPFCICWE